MEHYPESCSAPLSECRLEILSDWVDGILEGSGAELVRGHLITCESCRTEALHLERLRERFAAWKAPRPKPFFVERVIARLEAPAVPFAPRPSLGGRFREWVVEQMVPAGLATAAAAAIFFLFLRAPTTAPEQVTLDGLMSRSVAQEVRHLVTSNETDLSHDDLFSLLLVADVGR